MPVGLGGADLLRSLGHFRGSGLSSKISLILTPTPNAAEVCAAKNGPTRGSQSAAAAARRLISLREAAGS